MIPIRGLFETHLTVQHLQRSMRFFGDALGLELAQVFPERKVAFYWVGRPGDAMLGLWEAGMGPQRLSLHIAFRVDLDSLLQAAERLREANIIPLDFAGEPTGEPVVFAEHSKSSRRKCLTQTSLNWFGHSATSYPYKFSGRTWVRRSSSTTAPGR
jgi:Glyoxalase/Bleomycin resistance protein/Dioxygenase superfamily